MEDPFVLRLALDVTRRQLWDLQNKESYFAIRREFYSNLKMYILVPANSFITSICGLLESKGKI